MGKVAERFHAKRIVEKAAPDTRMTEQVFMQRRVMFCCPANSVVRIAGPGDPQGHRAWMHDMDDRVFDRTPRGYFLDGDLVFYRGHFEVVSARTIREALPDLVTTLDLPHATKVWSGARDIGTGALRGLHLIGEIADLIETQAAAIIT